MSGKISVQLGAGCPELYEIFKKADAPCSVVLPATEDAAALSLPEGWEAVMAIDGLGEAEVARAKEKWAAAGVPARFAHFSAPEADGRALLQKHFDGAFTALPENAEFSPEKMVMTCPINRYALRRLPAKGKTMAEIKAYIDSVQETDGYLAFFADGMDAAEMAELLAYCRAQGVKITTTAAALDSEICRVKIIREGFDGQKCFVHARMAKNENKQLIIAQLLDVRGSDCFDALQTCYSEDGGKSWTGFHEEENLGLWDMGETRVAISNATPLYHAKTGKFMVVGAVVNYEKESLFPLRSTDPRRVGFYVPYAVFDNETKKFGPCKPAPMPRDEAFRDAGGGCSQCCVTDSGEILIPVVFSTPWKDDVMQRVRVLRYTFDGEELHLAEVGPEIEVMDDAWGLAEPSVICHAGVYYCTLRTKTVGYVCKSTDGTNYSEPIPWTWEDGEELTCYNTQTHWLENESGLYLVYTRKNGKNDHVMRNRAPLYVARVNTETMALVREGEFVAVPERGARLGNFGAFSDGGKEMYVVASEWMQPVGCEAYGSNNALWLADITI